MKYSSHPLPNKRILASNESSEAKRRSRRNPEVRAMRSSQGVKLTTLAVAAVVLTWAGTSVGLAQSTPQPLLRPTLPRRRPALLRRPAPLRLTLMAMPPVRSRPRGQHRSRATRRRRSLTPTDEAIPSRIRKRARIRRSRILPPGRRQLRVMFPPPRSTLRKWSRRAAKWSR